MEANAIEFGSFTLASGKKSDYYANMKKVATNPSALDRIAEELSKNITARRIAGVELGALPLLIATALRLRIPFIIVRKAGKALTGSKALSSARFRGEKWWI